LLVGHLRHETNLQKNETFLVMFTIQKYVCTQKMSSLDKPRIGMFSHHGVMPAN